MTGLIRSILIGILYTFVSFTLALLFLHLATMFWFHQSGFDFLNELDSGRASLQERVAISAPGSLQDVLLRDKVYYFIISLIIGSIWILNINHQYNLNHDD